MDKQRPWDHLRQGTPEVGLRIIRERYLLDPNASHIMEMGIAYIWAGHYELAEQNFQQAINTHPTPGNVFYGMPGAAMWCLDDPGAAVRHWHEGLNAPYAVGGVGIHLPLLLFLASTLRPRVYVKEDAEGILRERVKNPRAKSWPGPLAKFVLGPRRQTNFRWPVQRGQPTRHTTMDVVH